MQSSLTYVVYEAELDGFFPGGQAALEDGVEQYATALLGVLSSIFPEMDVKVQIKRNVTGVGAGARVQGTYLEERDVPERAEEIAGRVLVWASGGEAKPNTKEIEYAERVRARQSRD